MSCSANEQTNRHQHPSSLNVTQTSIDADLETIRLYRRTLVVHESRNTRTVVEREEATRRQLLRRQPPTANGTNYTEQLRSMYPIWMRIHGWKLVVCRWVRLLLSRPQRCRFPSIVCTWCSTSNIYFIRKLRNIIYTLFFVSAF